jgi:L-threonylcarbamoyladenylate synthase
MNAWDEIQSALDKGEVVLLPTETVYGIAARADTPEAISKIYAIKGRDFDKPLAVCVRDLAQALDLAVFDTLSLALAERHWPGSLTLVLNLRDGADLDPRVTGELQGLRTIALRCPEAAWRRNIHTPLALTSANRSGQPDCVDYDRAQQDLGKALAAGLKSEAPLSGAPSTIIRIDSAKLTVLRQGDLEITL